MAGGSSVGRSLEQTPTWAVATVCFVLVAVSISIERLIHLIGKWFKNKHKRALYESLEKIKSELMLLGFISLLLTVGQGLISSICIPTSVANSWHPCTKQEEANFNSSTSEPNNTANADELHGRRRLLATKMSSSSEGLRRVLAAAETNKCAKGKVPFISTEGLHQLHIFIFALAVFHVLYCFLTMALGRLKMKKWKEWEKETTTMEYQFSHDPERFRFARDTTFGRRHLNTWSTKPVLIWIVCFVRQFVWSVPKVDYMTLRHGFITAHLPPESHNKFDFQKYINRSLEDDFKAVVGISPSLWFLAVIFILFNTHGWYSYLWLPFIPFVVILVVGTKLHVIITRLGVNIQKRGHVIMGIPVVEPGDHLFWFNRPSLLLYLINFVLFQNAFQLAFFFWTWYEFGFKSCFHPHTEDMIIRIAMGVLIQFLCSYITLPLYALVTQMGSSMKPTIFNERVAFAIKKWQRSAKKNLKQQAAGRASASITPMSSHPGTATPGSLSPVHLLRQYRSSDAPDSLHVSPRRSLSELPNNNINTSNWEITASTPSNYFHAGEGSSSSPKYSHRKQQRRHDIELEQYLEDEKRSQSAIVPQESAIDMDPRTKDFSFDKRMTQS